MVKVMGTCDQIGAHAETILGVNRCVAHCHKYVAAPRGEEIMHESKAFKKEVVMRTRGAQNNRVGERLYSSVARGTPPIPLSQLVF